MTIIYFSIKNYKKKKNQRHLKIGIYLYRSRVHTPLSRQHILTTRYYIKVNFAFDAKYVYNRRYSIFFIFYFIFLISSRGHTHDSPRVRVCVRLRSFCQCARLSIVKTDNIRYKNLREAHRPWHTTERTCALLRAYLSIILCLWLAGTLIHPHPNNAHTHFFIIIIIVFPSGYLSKKKKKVGKQSSWKFLGNI